MTYSLHYLLMADHILIQKQLFSKISDTNLSIGQPKVLDYLNDHNGAIQKDIAKGCHIEPASLSTVLNGMEKKGLIIRDTGDSKRSTRIFLTEKGKILCERIQSEFTEIEKAALKNLTIEEKENLIKYLAKIHSDLGDTNEK